MTQGLRHYPGIVKNEKGRRCKSNRRAQIKSYVILCTRDIMVVPIKANENPYNLNAGWFAAGTPQFFGGSLQGNQLQTLQQEVNEESRGSLQLNGIPNQPFYTVPPTDGDRKTYNFFYSQNWQNTEVLWNPNVSDPKQREMQRLVEVSRRFFDPPQDDEEDINDILLIETGTTQARGLGEFRSSHTATAFATFIRDIWSRL